MCRRLKQVISGKNIRLLYDGGNNKDGSIMITMQHPQYEPTRMVLEMVVDPEYKDNPVG